MSNEQTQQYQIDINANFSEIASRSLLFIDKSIDAMKLLQLNTNRVMVLRPPKFGKSIIMDMIEDFYLQKIDSFQKLNCRILAPPFGITFSKEKSSTVIRFKLKTNDMTKENYNEMILGELKKQYDLHNVSGFENFLTPNSAFEHLIAETTCYGQKKVVVLIDNIESILLYMEYNSTEFLTLTSTIQSILDVLVRWKDSIKYLLLLGSANFCNVSNIVRDFTFRPETAGTFGFNLIDMINSNIFYNQVGDAVKFPETRVQYFGTFQRTLQNIYDFSISNFYQIISTNLSGKISIEFLFYLILHSGNYKFSTASKVYVINPIDFLFAISESRIGNYWINFLRHQHHESFFSSFPDGEATVEKWLLKIFIHGNMILPEDIPYYRSLIPLGFLSFKGEAIVIPNLTILEFIANTSVRNYYQRCLNNYTSLKDSTFNVILEKMPSFPEYEKLPSLVFKSNSWDYALFYYLYHVFPDVRIQVANDGTFLIINNSFIISLFFKGELEQRLIALERETQVPIILIKITITNVVCVETCYRHDNQVQRYKLDFWNPNCFIVTSLFPYLYTQDQIKDQTNANPNSQNENSKENKIVEKKEEVKEEDNKTIDPNKLLSFSDIVKECMLDLHKRKSQYVTLNMIMNDIVKKMPHFASDPSLDKSILLSLYYLSKIGVVKYKSNSKGNVEYTLLQFQGLVKVSS